MQLAQVGVSKTYLDLCQEGYACENEDLPRARLIREGTFLYLDVLDPSAEYKDLTSQLL